jgi:glutamate:GABA antiporter
MQNLGMLISVTTLFFGLEMTAVHAANVKAVKHNFPCSIIISSVILVVLLLSGSLAIAFIVPSAQLSNVSGLLDAMQLVFENLHASVWFKPVCALIFIGNLDSVSAWMLSSTRGMWVASWQNHLPDFFCTVNRKESLTGILMIEAGIFSLAMSVFLFFPHLTDSYWLLLDLSAQLNLIYYIILFTAAGWLQQRTTKKLAWISFVWANTVDFLC